MDKSSIGHHISRQFNEELEDIRNRVLAMGGLVEQQISDAITAILNEDSQLGETVVKNDYQVNALEVAIDEECNQVLARRQPAASDLRLVVAVIKTITDLERIGDEAEKIGRMAIRLSELEGTFKNYTGLRAFGEHVRMMLHDALDAYARLDTQAAVSVASRDHDIDKEYEGMVRQLITHMMEDPRMIRPSLDVMWSVRALERIGDHACNICEYVIYLVEGKDVRHITFEQMEQEVLR
jgi:phosphate transport system protein